MKKTLYMEFVDTGEEVFKLSVADCKENLTTQEVTEAMTQIIGSNAFKSKGGDLASVKQAYTITEQVDQLI